MIPRYFLLLFLIGLFSTQSVSQYKDISVLANGEIFKIAVSESGVYKIDASFLQNSLGIDLSQINPQSIAIYGNGGGILPEDISQFRHDDLVENAISVIGEQDGSFDSNDYILFYGQGADKWKYNHEIARYDFEKNIYDLNNYYFLKTNVEGAKRISTAQAPPSADRVFTNYDRMIRHENDETNLLGAFSSTEGTGQQWFGEVISGGNKLDFSQFFTLGNPVLGSEAKIEISMAVRSASSTQMKYTINGMEDFTLFPSTSIGNVEATYAHVRNKIIRFDLQNSFPEINIQFNGNTDATGWVDFIQLDCLEEMKYEGRAFPFSHNGSNDFLNAGFRIKDAGTNLEVWDISNISQSFKHNLVANNEGAEFLYESNYEHREFYIFDPSASHPSPEFIEKVENQNLHGLNDLEYVIIASKEFIEAANSLSLHRASLDGLNTKVVNINQVYNEFGSGKKDPTALRDFVRMLKKRNDNFNYLLLFGDASYDYRGIVDGLAYQNYVPTYETKESLSPIFGFPSDDYFALISDNEGVDNLKGALDITVGRIPVRDSLTAMRIVEKIIHYDTSPSILGEWKLNIGFAADDEDNNTHIEDSEEIALKNELIYPYLNQQKVYFDSYEQLSTPGGERYPDANQAINQNIEQGQLVLNYLGHGGPKGWAQERVLQINDVNSWSNIDKMPIIVTATCSFTGYDDPAIVTVGEHAIANPEGTVALFTTVRAVFASENKRLASAVYDQLFVKEKGIPQRLGDILTRAKNSNSADTLKTNARKFALIGDPAMRIGLPIHEVSLDKINDVEAIFFEDTLRALTTVKLEGSIRDFQFEQLSDFNGEVFLTVFDKASQIKTLANDTKSQVMDFDVYKNVIFKGSASVENGEFEINFIIPKDINFDEGYGKFSFYAHDNNRSDAAGFYDDIIIGGSSENIADDQPPRVALFMNDESFRDGGVTDDSPILLIKLEDDFGINVSGTSIGHDLTMVVDNKIELTTVLNDFYVADINNYRKGEVRFPLKDISPGLHTIDVKAWDIANNSSEASLSFRVLEADNSSLYEVFNYPNPFNDITYFNFEHDLGGQDLEISVEIYSTDGRFIKEISDLRPGAGYRINDLFWDGTGDNGGRLAKGMYIYRTTISSLTTGETRQSKFTKLVLL